MANKLAVPSKVLTVVLLGFLNMQSAMDDDPATGRLRGVQQVIVTIIIMRALRAHMARCAWGGLCYRRVQDGGAVLACSVLPQQANLLLQLLYFQPFQQ
jgi:hypothetical protein